MPPRNYSQLTLAELAQMVDALNKDLSEYKQTAIRQQEYEREVANQRHSENLRKSDGIEGRLREIETLVWKAVGLSSGISVMAEIVIQFVFKH